MKRKNYEAPLMITERFVTDDVLCSSGDPHFIKNGVYSAGRKTYADSAYETLKS